VKTIYIVRTRYRRGRGWSSWMSTVCQTWELAREYEHLHTSDGWQAQIDVACYFDTAESMNADHAVRAARLERQMREAAAAGL
jgi:hypothetical protein